MIKGRGWEGLPVFSKELYKATYFRPEENYEEWLRRTTEPYQNDEEHGDRIREYIRNYWYHSSTPVSTGMGNPVACFISHIEDSRKGIFDGYHEGMWLGAEGGGRGVIWSNVRGAGSKVGQVGESPGVIPFLGISDRTTMAVSQGNIRRSSETAWMDVSHPDIKEFLNIRLPTGDPYQRTPNLHHGVVVSNKFMEAVTSLTDWELLCPHTGGVIEILDAFELWMDILETRAYNKGEPNIMFKDNVNSQLPVEYQKLGLDVTGTNICNEILLYTSPKHTAVCVLGSVNLEYWEEYSDELPQVIADTTDFLDNVLQFFVDKNADNPWFANSIRGASYGRDVGLGTMGWHSLLQKKSIPFESAIAKGLNIDIFKRIREASDAHQASLPESSLCPMSIEAGTHRRNVHTLATAPTMSISSLSNVTSSGIEPWLANSFTKKVQTGSYTIRNKFLTERLQKLGMDTPEVWSSINKMEGSVQHLEGLPDWDKDVFKTAYEIDQQWLVEFAANRQPYIDQGQSLNLFIPSGTDIQEIHDIHMAAWEKGIKTLYYLRSTSAKRADMSTKGREAIELEDDACIGCT